MSQYLQTWGYCGPLVDPSMTRAQSQGPPTLYPQDTLTLPHLSQAHRLPIVQPHHRGQGTRSKSDRPTNTSPFVVFGNPYAHFPNLAIIQTVLCQEMAKNRV